MLNKNYKFKIKEIEADVNKLMSALTNILHDTHIYNKCKDEDYFYEFFKKDRPKPIDFSAFDFDEFSKKDFPTKMHLKENLTKEFKNVVDHFTKNFRFLTILYNREIENTLNGSLRIKEDDPDPYCPFCFEKDIHITKIDNYFDLFFEGEFAEVTDDYDFISEHKGFCNLCGGKWIDYYDADNQHLLFFDTW